MSYSINRVAVIGAGTMGAAIAAHLAVKGSAKETSAPKVSNDVTAPGPVWR